MSTMNGSVYRESVARSVYSDSFHSNPLSGYAAPARPHSSTNNLEVPRAPSRTRSPRTSSALEVAAVDPTLEDAQKAGNNYHITMSLNAALADAGFPTSSATAMGRTSRSEYSTNSRNQMDYSTNSRNVSRIGIYPNENQVSSSRISDDQGRNGRISVIQVAGSDILTYAPSPSLVIPKHNSIAVKEAYTVKSVRPSSTRMDVSTTVQRVPTRDRVGFDLELIGGQTTTITETAESGSTSRIASMTKKSPPSDNNSSNNYDKLYTSEHFRSWQEEKKKKNRSPDPPAIDVADFYSVNRNRKPEIASVSHLTERYVRDFSDDEGSREEEVNVEYYNPWLAYDDGSEKDASLAIYRQLVKGAHPGSVQQRITVEKDEDEIIKSKHGNIPKDLLNVDTVSEKINVRVGDGMAQMTIKVRTEQIVPIQDSDELFRKSAVTIKRVIEVDMMATRERQRIYDAALQKQRTTGEDLSQKDTFDLYKAFLMLVDSDNGEGAREQVRIDKTTDEAKLEDFGLGIGNYARRDSFDTESDQYQTNSRTRYSTSYRKS